MNAFETTSIRGLLITALVGMLMACGGGGGSSSESVIARGVITQMGSIWVNGVEYETPKGGSYKNDDDTSDTASYEVGQVVNLSGILNDDGVSGTADEVNYEAEIEGAASGGAINGVTIRIDPSHTNVTNATLISGALIDGFRYEVSGFWINSSLIDATFIKNDDDSGSGGDGIDEVKGFVEVVVSTSITVRGVIYLFPNAADFSKGDFVEVHFNPTSCTGSIPNRTCNADIIELEDDFNDEIEGMEFEIEGTVNKDFTDLATFCSTRPGTDFMIDMTCIDWDFVESWEDGLKDEKDLVSGLRVEAEGHFNGAGLLIAEKIKGRGNQVRISAIASSIVLDAAGTTGSLVVFADVATPIDVTFESGLTEIDFNGDTNLLLANPTTEGLEIRGIRIRDILTGVTSVLALRIKDDSVNPNRQELRAEVDDDGANSTLDTITVMGISSLLDANTQLEDEDDILASGGGSTTAAQIFSFLEMIDDDGIVNISNGPNDVVEVRIDTTNGGVGSTVSPYAAKQVEIEREDD